MSNADYSNWMGNLPERLTKVPLGHLAIPGSHNSFTSTLDPSLGVAVDQSESIQNLGSSCCGAVTKIIQRWSTNQSMAMLDQLTAGIRYFDLRVCKKPDTEQFHFLHGLYGDNVKSLLGTIKTFFEDNPKEVAILDMNHFYNMEPSDHDRLLWEIEDIVGDLLVPVNGYQYKLWSLTLANIWNHPGRIILIYHNPFNAATFPKIWNKNVIQSPWPNTSSKESLVDFLETNYTEKKRPPGYTFYVWQGCLTPGTGTIALRLCCSLENALARPATTAFVNWVKNKAPGIKMMYSNRYPRWHLALPWSHGKGQPRTRRSVVRIPDLQLCGLFANDVQVYEF
ncbi:PI-PLC X domain-containing protein 3-like isoform X2 [Haliotis rufescens]|uniref:PI-PLC X domain-containing protein 3-like isoform X2 n=1 Tax=Haliotis rufescens TaxID=6454 RepID=UPI00201F7549|nr:PI-PLC X domain-containing protein 3-like isoform X2 [Haliotis rufescens]